MNTYFTFFWNHHCVFGELDQHKVRDSRQSVLVFLFKGLWGNKDRGVTKVDW